MTNRQIINKKAHFDFEILETFEGGLVLTGEEIKAIRAGRVTLTGAYAKIMNGEVWLLGGNFNVPSGDTARTKKILLHADQIKRLIGKTAESGLTLVPIKIYLKKGYAKVELGLAKGAKKSDKRAKIKEREQNLDISRKIKQF